MAWWNDGLANFLGMGAGNSHYGYDQLDPQRFHDAQNDALMQMGAALAQGGLTGQYGTAITQGLMGGRQAFRQDLDAFEKQRQSIYDEQLRNRGMNIQEAQNRREQHTADQADQDRAGASAAMSDLAHSVLATGAMTPEQAKLAASMMMAGPKAAPDVFKLFADAVSQTPEVQRRELAPKLQAAHDELALHYGAPLGNMDPIKGLVTPREDQDLQARQIEAQIAATRANVEIARGHLGLAQSQASGQDQQLRRGQRLQEVMDEAARLQKQDTELAGTMATSPEQRALVAAATARLEGKHADGSPFDYIDAARTNVDKGVGRVEPPPADAGMAYLRSAKTVDEYNNFVSELKGKYSAQDLAKITGSVAPPKPKPVEPPKPKPAPIVESPPKKPATPPAGGKVGSAPPAKAVPASREGAKAVVAEVKRRGATAPGPRDPVMEAQTPELALAAWGKARNTNPFGMRQEVRAMKANGKSDREILKWIRNEWLTSNEDLNK